MLSEEEYELVRQFFGGYFHEDWGLDAPNRRELVALYMNQSGMTPEQLHSLSKAIGKYGERYPDDHELSDRLYRELGCCYMPSADGLSAHQWLETIARQLLEN